VARLVTWLLAVEPRVSSQRKIQRRTLEVVEVLDYWHRSNPTPPTLSTDLQHPTTCNQLVRFMMITKSMQGSRV